MGEPKVIDMVLVESGEGELIYAEVDPETTAQNDEIVVRPGGVIEGIRGGAEPTTFSALPRERMAVDVPPAWADIARGIRDKEQGRSPATEVVVRPGGAVEIARPGEPTAMLSQLPQDVMA